MSVMIRYEKCGNWPHEMKIYVELAIVCPL